MSSVLWTIFDAPWTLGTWSWPGPDPSGESRLPPDHARTGDKEACSSWTNRLPAVRRLAEVRLDVDR